MSKLPPVRPKDLARVARKLGFVLDRQKGSHAVYFRAAGPSSSGYPHA
jgi:predicted RNA binding protein YcfA (HicA-like mRNA interferase family)